MIKPRPNFIQSLGFTMIELLIVISILGFLAVAVLAAINPIEQINRGKDTGSRSDAEQLLSAMDRFYSANGYYIWQTGVTDTNTATSITGASAASPGAPASFDATTGPRSAIFGAMTAGCTWEEKLTNPVNPGCPGANELKTSFTTRIMDVVSYNTLLVYNRGQQGDSTYICFQPKSKQFRDEASTRCGDAAGAGLPVDLRTIGATLCAGYGGAGVIYSCLP